MADANHTPPAHPATHGFIPLATASQHCYISRDATLYLNTNAPTDALYEAAIDRLSAVIDLLSVLERIDQDDAPISNVFLISRALLLLASDAQSLYQADFEKKHRRA
ncbi:hypothetical protein N5J43_03050 [Pseudomonas nicosulfuronedens]|uniref:DUF3077 domain-containing protein n=1 Tax=Pseudomonas nicosulfuronedens TaxID=2571105 RepID=A0A5R9QVL3_9PSED|nr:hypothetical protein [Pseudomonas nicosulfuronedens]MDH1009000.1 hypothetical protein [Pseudomonas nicosulfuronedens]MDH1977913.1 hypothetical protein [Pseudomonas nicosulfuronedens]MDH2028697.1 hypothetical protein [Pseudomonas nicosulfuronedens]TLX73399.1 hypothetical protein FAS41_21225 [Pseudomonas nicosulfuronedens]